MFFNSLKAQKVENPGAKGKFTKVLEGYMEKQDVETWLEQYAEDLIINKE